MRQPDSRAHFSLAAAMTIAGTSVVSGKYIVESFPIFIGSGLRTVIAAVILIALVWWREQGFARLSRRTHAGLMLQALSGITIFNAFMLAGLERTSASTSGIITSATPLLILLLSLLLGERLTRRGAGSIAIATAGLVVLNLYGGGEGGSSSGEVIGGLLVLVAVVGEALYTIFGRLVADDVTPLAQTMWVSIYGAISFLPFALFELPDFELVATRPSGWIAVIYAATLVTVVSAWLWFNGLRTVPASRAGTFTGLMPVSAVALSAALLGEAIRWPHLVGMTCVIAAILLVSWRRATLPERLE